jgi:hypothetical protein
MLYANQSHCQWNKLGKNHSSVNKNASLIWLDFYSTGVRYMSKN